MFEHLRALVKLGCEVSVWQILYEDERAECDEYEALDASSSAFLASSVRSIHRSTFPRVPGLIDRIRAKVTPSRGTVPVRNPVLAVRARRELERLMQKEQPDFIWAEHLAPLQLALQQSAVPVIYSHLDWVYRVKALADRSATLTDARRYEEALALGADAVVSGSAVDVAELERLGCSLVRYIPPSFEPPSPLRTAEASADLRVVHLGGFRTTATRVGMREFLKRVWPGLANDRVTLQVVGDMTGMDDELRSELAAAECTGFQADLSKVLRPFDVHVIPWEHATGQRTRLPVAFSYGQVVVATRASVACFPEAVDGANCRLVDTLEDMVPVVKALLADPVERVRLGTAARHAFDECFTLKGALPRYEDVVAEVMQRGPRLQMLA